MRTSRHILDERALGPAAEPPTRNSTSSSSPTSSARTARPCSPSSTTFCTDFPQAHFVFENFPLTAIHTEAYKAATYSVCVAQLGGNEAFFKFADAVFAAQENLTPTTSDSALADAVTKAGLDPAKVGSCAYTTAAKATVDASIKLAQDLDVNQTPMLFINGRQIPIGEVANNELPYDTLKQIVAYQFSLDQ